MTAVRTPVSSPAGAPVRQPNTTKPSPIENVWRVLIRRAVRFWRSGDPGTLLIVIALLVLPAISLGSVLSVQQSAVYWPVTLGQLPIISLLSVLFGYILARSRYGELLSMVVSLLYCIASIGVLQVLNAPGNPIQRVVGVATRFLDSIGQIQQGAASDPFLLVIFLSFLFWFLAYNTVWHVFRIDRLWRAVVPPALVLLINGLYNFTSFNLNLYLITYLFLALLLGIRSHLNVLEYEWYERQIAFDERLRARFYQIGAGLSGIVLIVAWLLPTGSAQQNQDQFQQFLNGNLLNQFNKTWSRLLTPLDSVSPTASDYYGSDSLQLSGGTQLGDDPVMSVSVSNVPDGVRFYWQSRVFDTYRGGVWYSSFTDPVTATASPLDLKALSYAPNQRQEIAQTFTIQTQPSNLVYAAPAPVQVQLPAKAEVTKIDVIGADSGAEDVTDIRPLSVLAAGTQYTVISSVSTATVDQMEAATPVYAPWLAPDMQIDPSVAPRTAALASQIIGKASTVYDKAKAIESWLRTNVNYQLALPTPPTNVDPIDWAILDKKEAYCTYYASAMIVMLRTLHIPARMGAGFAEGDRNPITGQYDVVAKDAHTWVQVYFNGEGWVEFEPTQAQPALDRNAGSGNKATSTPSPTPTPLPTNTPTAQPSEQLTSTPQGQNSAPTQPPPEISATPTGTPIAPPANATPPPLLQLPTLPPQLGGLLALAGIGALLIAGIAFVAIGLLWWFEYRGLGHLSPVGRAYARLSLYMRWLRLGTPAGATPLERGRLWMRKAPEQAASIGAITDLYIAERYAPPRPRTPDEEIRANTAWRLARGGFLARKIRSWLPRGRRGNAGDAGR